MPGKRMNGNTDSMDQNDEELVLSSDVDWDAIALVLETCGNDEVTAPLPSWVQVPSFATPEAECNPHELETAATDEAPSLGPSVFPIEEEGGRRSNRRRKSPGAPKRPTSAYLFFYKEARPLVKARLGPNANATDVMRAVGEDWKAVPSDVRARCEAKAAAEKERYNREYADYFPAPRESTGAPPKRNRSGFLIFADSERRKAVKMSHPEMSSNEVQQTLAQQWHSMSEEGQAVYNHRAAEELKTYQDELMRYKARHKKAKGQQHQSTKAQWDGNTSDFEDSTGALGEEKTDAMSTCSVSTPWGYCDR